MHLAYKLPLTIMDSLCIVVIILFLSIVARKHFYCNDEENTVCDLYKSYPGLLHHICHDL